MALTIIVNKVKETSGGFYVIRILNNHNYNDYYDAPQIPNSIDFDDLQTELEGSWAASLDENISREDLEIEIIIKIEEYIEENL